MIPREVTDAGTAGAAMTAPVWLQWLEQALQPFMLYGAATLLLLRLIIALRELLKPVNKEKDRE